MVGGAVALILLPMFAFLALFPICNAIAVAYRLHDNGPKALYRLAKWGPLASVFGGYALAKGLSAILPSTSIHALTIILTLAQTVVLLASVGAIAQLSHRKHRYLAGAVLAALCMFTAAILTDGAGLTHFGTPRVFLAIAYFISQLFA